MAGLEIASPTAQQIKNKLIDEYHPDLVGIKHQIIVMFKEKASSRGGVKILGTSKKMPKIANVIAGKDYIFQIEVAEEEWENLNNHKRCALIDHHLCSLRSEKLEQTNDTRYFIAPPEISYYRDEVERWNYWRSDEDIFETEDIGKVKDPENQLGLFNQDGSIANHSEDEDYESDNVVEIKTPSGAKMIIEEV